MNGKTKIISILVILLIPMNTNVNALNKDQAATSDKQNLVATAEQQSDSNSDVMSKGIQVAVGVIALLVILFIYYKVSQSGDRNKRTVI